MALTITYIGGPTALIDFGGVRLLTDPTFDPAGAESTSGTTLRKTQSPAVDLDTVGPVDVVLLSHDHHFDNLDASGRRALTEAKQVLTTPAAHERLGPPSRGIGVWEELRIPAERGRTLRVVGAPARHGPAEGDRGPVTGFVLAFEDRLDDALYVSGDTVWFEGVSEVARRYAIRVACLFMGAAQTAAAGPWPLTFTAAEGVQAAQALAGATIVPLHYDGWQHFTEGRHDIEQAFARAGISHRLRWLAPGVPTEV